MCFVIRFYGDHVFCGVVTVSIVGFFLTINTKKMEAMEGEKNGQCLLFPFFF